MFKKIDILKFARLLFTVMAVLFLLSACNTGETAKDNRALGEDRTNEQILEEQGKCWQSNVLNLIYDTLGNATMKVYGQVTHGALPLMMMAFAIWFAMRILTHVGSVTEENIAEVWKEVMIKLFLCLVCGIMASSTDFIIYLLNILIFPIYNAFLEFGSYIMQYGETKGKYESMWGGEPVIFKMPSICSIQGGVKAGLDTGFPEAPRNMMSCMVCSANERMMIGSELAFNSLRGLSWTGMIIGAIVWLIFLFVRLGFVFYLVDTVFRFAIMIILLPIFIMAYAFKTTRKWTTTGVKTILNSSAFMCAIAIILTITMLAMEQLFAANSDFISGDTSMIDHFEDFSVFFLCLILICFLLLSSIKVAKEVADSLVGGGGEANFQKKAKAALEFVASIVLAVVTAGAGSAAQGVAKGAQKAGAAAAKEAKKYASKAKSTGKKFINYGINLNNKNKNNNNDGGE
ncbi:MAG: type IV secretion system protein [Alphaproteobacteria bacterium]